MKTLTVSLLLLLSTLSYGGEKVLYSFQGGNDGQFPRAGLVADNAGNFFGTTEFGGTGPCVNDGLSGCGTVFELSPNGHSGWVETVLYSFQGQTDGQWPLSALVIDAAGNIYGTSQIGGGTNDQCPPSCGSAFELSPGSQGWTLRVLHAFKGGADGGVLLGGLAADSAGTLYGTTYLGGHSDNGTLFQLSLESGRWKLTTLHRFANCVPGSDGGNPNGSPLFSMDGNIYGTTECGGKYGGGTIYRFSQANGKWKGEIIHSFGGSNGDRGVQLGDLSQDKAGNLYGIGGGFNGGFNYAYRMSLVNGKWKRKNIHRFSRGQGDGVPNPYLTLDAAGNIYGTAGGAPELPFGKVYMLTPSGNETVLYKFKGEPDGQYPASKLLLDQKDNLWGTTTSGGTGTNCGGAQGCGTVFQITQ